MRLLRSPLFHFLALGALLFAANARLVARDAEAAQYRIALDATRIAELERDFERQVGRAPDARELDGLVEAHLEEEMLYREAVARGLLERDGDGQLQLTPRMQRGMQHRSFLEIFRGLKASVRDGHEAPEAGSRGERSEGTRPYEFGDPVSELDLSASMRNAIRRLSGERAAESGVLPIRFLDRDFELFNTESTADTALATTAIAVMSKPSSMLKNMQSPTTRNCWPVTWPLSITSTTRPSGVVECGLILMTDGFRATICSYGDRR